MTLFDSELSRVTNDARTLLIHGEILWYLGKPYSIFSWEEFQKQLDTQKARILYKIGNYTLVIPEHFRICEQTSNSLIWYSALGMVHREDGPALVYKSGREEWWKNNQLHREDGPAISDTNYKAWAIRGHVHRIGGPAIERKESREYYIRGKLHRIGGPAIETEHPDNCQYYLRGTKVNKGEYDEIVYKWKNNLKILDLVQYQENEFGDLYSLDSQGRLHNENGPAVINSFGSQLWFRNGKFHRDNGPAVTGPGLEIWYENDFVHRENGPALTDDLTKEIWRVQQGKLKSGNVLSNHGMYLVENGEWYRAKLGTGKFHCVKCKNWEDNYVGKC